MSNSESRSSAASNSERPKMHDWGDACEYMEKLEAEIAALKHDLDRHMQIAVDLLNDAQPSAPCPWCGFENGHHPWCRSPAQPIAAQPPSVPDCSSAASERNRCACGERKECDHSCMPDVIDGFCSHCGTKTTPDEPQQSRVRAALEDVSNWLEGCLHCRTWSWDGMQRDAAEAALAEAQAALALTRPQREGENA